MPATGGKRWIPVLVLLGAAAAGYGIWSAMGRGNQPPGAVPAEPLPVKPAAPPDIGPTPAQAELPLPPAAKVPTPGHIAFPDGTFFPLLNGATGIDKLLFHPSQPFTKVVGKMRDAQGREWYVHEGGMRTTTFVDRNGRSVSQVESPGSVKPVLPEELGGTGR